MADENTHVKDPADQHRRWRAYRILGQVAGALSLLNLARDLQWVSLKGVLAQWILGYHHAVTSVAHFLFAWIHVSWVQFSDLEAHCVVICMLLLTALARADRNTGPIENMLALVTFFVAFAVLMLLLPEIWSIIVVSLVACFFVVGSTFDDTPGLRRRDVAINLAEIVGIALAIVLVDLLFFR